MSRAEIEKAYALSREQYAEAGVDVDQALEALASISLSLPCWQGDDVRGFEVGTEALSSGGVQATGNYPGRARSAAELRQDLKKALSLIPGAHRLNLHAIYGEFGGKRVERNEVEPAHFRDWVAWAKDEKIKLDFNATCFSHRRADSGFTLGSQDKETRKFWIEHVNCCRRIAAFFGRELKKPSIHNLWIPDGSKDAPVDRWTPRALLRESLDE
ncbi:MAG: L-rhamnose isomerase, partial [Acidobacteriota bacterium]